MSIELTDVLIGHQKQSLIGPIQLRIAKGSSVALLGPNGSGKSTLLRTLAGEIKPLGGQVTLSARSKCAYLAQSQSHLKTAPLSVRDVVTMGLWSKLGLFGRPCRHDQAAIDTALEATGLAEMADLPIGELSGGQVQRALFARLMVQDCDLILLDEPFTALDEASQNDLMAIITTWHQKGKTIVAALHDRSVARQFPLWLDLGASGGVSLQAGGRETEGPPETGLRVIAGGMA